MKPTDVIKKAILSEKAYKQMEKSIYTFLVDARSTKDQIEKQVEKQFSVEVQKVNVATRAFKTKRIARTRKETKTGGGKKAIVWLKAGQSIAMISPKKESEKSKKRHPSPKEKDIQTTSAEGKEG